MIGTLLANRFGGLSVWSMPIQGRQYAVGVDCGSGVRNAKTKSITKEGDPSAACVIDMETCEQVAEWEAYIIPQLWGFAVARLAAFYNEAPLAIETQPSQHGINAYDAAARYPYTNLWCQQRINLRDGSFSERKGWARAAYSTEVLFNRVREALHVGCPVRSERLLDQLSACYQEEVKVKSSLHDDCIVAYAIALCVRDQAYIRGDLKPKEAPIEDIGDLYWRRELVEDTPLASRHTHEEEWNGI